YSGVFWRASARGSANNEETSRRGRRISSRSPRRACQEEASGAGHQQTDRNQGGEQNAAAGRANSATLTGVRVGKLNRGVGTRAAMLKKAAQAGHDSLMR